MVNFHFLMFPYSQFRIVLLHICNVVQNCCRMKLAHKKLCSVFKGNFTVVAGAVQIFCAESPPNRLKPQRSILNPLCANYQRTKAGLEIGKVALNLHAHFSRCSLLYTLVCVQKCTSVCHSTSTQRGLGFNSNQGKIKYG